MNCIEIVQLLVEHLPYNWEHAWDELDDEAQEQVVIVRKAAWKFVSEHQIKQPKAYNWKPQPDITAYELALAIPILSFHTFDTEARIDAFPEQVRRHFEEVEEEK